MPARKARPTTLAGFRKKVHLNARRPAELPKLIIDRIRADVGVVRVPVGEIPTPFANENGLREPIRDLRFRKSAILGLDFTARQRTVISRVGCTPVVEMLLPCIRPIWRTGRSDRA